MKILTNVKDGYKEVHEAIEPLLKDNIIGFMVNLELVYDYQEPENPGPIICFKEHFKNGDAWMYDWDWYEGNSTIKIYDVCPIYERIEVK